MSGRSILSFPVFFFLPHTFEIVVRAVTECHQSVSEGTVRGESQYGQKHLVSVFVHIGEEEPQPEVKVGPRITGVAVIGRPRYVRDNVTRVRSEVY